ncbi:MAG: amidohydrolase family protein [Acidobacteriota bacterium]|nr:amidohydrolase family protein [Acidobacteriota bacterium]
MICDAHIHFFSPGFFAALGATKDAVAKIGFDDPVSTEALADRWVAELDKNGVARAALMASLPGDADSVAVAVLRHPSRFVGFFMVDPCRDDAVTYATRSLDEGLRTICLFPAMHRYSLYDDKVAKIFELAASRRGGSFLSAEAPGAKAEDPPAPPDAPAIFVHCGVLSVGVRKKLGLPSAFDIAFGNPAHLHALALKYSTVPLIVPHFGAGMLREALMLADLCPNVYLDTSSSNSWIKYTPGLTLEAVFSSALAVAGPDRLLFGTDSSFFPRGWNREVYEKQKAALDRIGAPEDVQQKIFGGNFARLFEDSSV